MIAELAARLGVEERALRAVFRVECASDDPARWLGPEGRPLLRVEAQLVLRRLRLAPPLPLLRIRTTGAAWYGGPGEPFEPWKGHEVLLDGAWSDYHRQDRLDGRACEWDAWDAARTLIGEAGADECASWGCGQVLGSHWRALGLERAARVRELAGTPQGCLDLVEGFLRKVAPPECLGALRTRTWLTFARHYNGPGKAADYAGRLVAAYADVG